jgi:adenosylmethionine-8-amino-7-oxononanoate aminotransferase
MACRLALETMDILEQEVLPALPAQMAVLQRVLKPLAELEHVGDARQCGFIGALELVEDCATKRAYALERRIGRQVYRAALRRGALLRPLGDVLYFLPPLTTPAEVLEELGAIARDSIREVTAR